MDGTESDRRAPAPTIRLAGRGRGPGAVVALIALFVAVAWIKPWPAGAPAATRPPAGPTARPAQPTADPLSSLRYHCQEPSGWRVYARERWGGRDLRSWRTMDPARTANGPLDPAIPVAPLGAAIGELGYCSPWTTSARPPDDATVAAWRLTIASASGSWQATTVGLRTTAPAPATVAAALFAPPAAASDRSAAPVSDWAAGRWVFAVRGTGYERWWAIDIRELAPPSVIPPGGTIRAVP